MSSSPMTAAQGRVLDALREITMDGWPAGVREVAAKCGFASVSTAQMHLASLERLGVAARNPRGHIGWRPVEVTEQPDGPGCPRHLGDPHPLCGECWKAEAEALGGNHGTD